MSEQDHDTRATRPAAGGDVAGAATASRPMRATGGAMFCPMRGVSGQATQRIDRERKKLLHVRLKSLALLIAGLEVLVIIRFVLVEQPAVIIPGVMLLVSVGTALILWLRPALPTGQLIALKSVFFLTLVAGAATNMVIVLENTLAAGNHEAFVANINRIPGIWLIIMLAFAMFIPDTWKQALAFVGICTIADFAAAAVMRFRHGPVTGLLDGPQLLDSMSFGAVVFIGGGGIAVFGTYVMNRYRRDMAEMGDAGMYRLVQKLGAGGMGEVWEAEHRLLARPAAIKMIRNDLLEGGRIDPATVTGRFEREARATAALQSPHTVQLYDFGVTGDGTFFYVMEYLRGMDLDELVRKHGPLPPARAVYMLRQAAQSLQEAHERGLVHRDIKPGNLHVGSLAGDYDWLKVLDFGLVKSFQQESDDSIQLTQEGVTTGTPAYFPPEMAQGASNADSRADVYALAAVAYWLLTGQLVFDGAGPMDMVVKHIRDTPEPPSMRVETPISASLDAAILSGLKKDPEARPQSMRDFARLLDDADTGRPWTQAQAAEWWRLHLPESAPARVA